jgi:hypothetical protein
MWIDLHLQGVFVRGAKRSENEHAFSNRHHRAWVDRLRQVLAQGTLNYELERLSGIWRQVFF